jgi:intracellular sulfur oxidation DsrE/DsrF family protein
MDRRRIFQSVLALGGALFAAGAPARAATAGGGGVAYHLADLEKVTFVLGNIRNHLDGATGARIALVVHGPALSAFRISTPNKAIKSDVADLERAGVEFHACRHTMEAERLSLGDLLPGFAVTENGAVVKLAELQAQGWAYLRP